MDMCFDIGLRLSNSSISGILCSKFASLEADGPDAPVKLNPFWRE